MLHTTFASPPASVQDAITSWLLFVGVSPAQIGEAERRLLAEAVVYGYVAATGRLLSLPPLAGDACNTNPMALQLKAHALQVLQESVLAISREPSAQRRLDA